MNRKTLLTSIKAFNEPTSLLQAEPSPSHTSAVAPLVSCDRLLAGPSPGCRRWEAAAAAGQPGSRRRRGRQQEEAEEEGAGRSGTAPAPNAAAQCEGRWESSTAPPRSSGSGLYLKKWKSWRN